MKLKVLGSGSTGNCYILENEQEALIIDAGIRFFEVKKALRFQVRKIVGVIVTHKHGDHAAFVHEYMGAGIPVFRPYEAESLRQNIRYGGFRIQSWEAVHDVPCVGYLIDHDDFGRMLYVTDTEYVKYRFRGITQFLIEANYSNELVDREHAKYLHVLSDHLELQTTIGCILANQSKQTKRITLCHLSADNADPEAFKTAVEAIAVDGCIVDVARPGMAIEL